MRIAKKALPFVILVVAAWDSAHTQSSLRDNFDTSAVCADLSGRFLWQGDLGDNTTWMMDSGGIRPKPFIGDPCGPDTNFGWVGMVRWDSSLAGNFEFSFKLINKTPPNEPQPSFTSNVDFYITDTQKALSYVLGGVGYNAHGYFLRWMNVPDADNDTWTWIRVDSGGNDFGWHPLHTTIHEWNPGEEAKIQVKKDAYNTVALLINGEPVDSIRDSAWTDLRFLAIRGGVGHNTLLDDFAVGPFNNVVCSTLSILPPNLPDGRIGVAYAESLTVDSGAAPSSFSVAGGSLPPGLALSTEGILSGVPSHTGEFTFTLLAIDANGCFVRKELHLSVQCSAITIHPDSLVPGIAGEAYPPTLFEATGGLGSVIYSDTGSLPTGMTIADGLLSGTPTKTGSYTFTIFVTDSADCPGSRSYTLHINCQNISLAPSILPVGTTGLTYPTTTFSQTGALGPVVYDQTGQLPAGLIFNGGAISGTPLETGSFPIQVSATDSNGCVGTIHDTLIVSCPSFDLKPDTLRKWTPGVRDSVLLTATGGVGAKTFSLTNGSLPAGFTLLSSGLLVGYPTSVESSAVIITATDSVGCSVSKMYSIRADWSYLSLGLTAGWEMISVPLKVPDNRKSVLFPFALSSAWKYAGTYQKSDSLTNGIGYWLKHGLDTSVVFAGVIDTAETIGVNRGWNIIGSISSSVPISAIGSDPPAMTISDFFDYTSSGYSVADTIWPGKGYWVKANQGGRLILLGAGNNMPRSMRVKILAGSALPPAPPDERSEQRVEIPRSYSLGQNFPNPFNPTTTFRFAIPYPSHVRLEIFNPLGEVVSTVVDGEMAEGYHTISWSPSVASGFYLYRLTATSSSTPMQSFSQTRKLLFLK